MVKPPTTYLPDLSRAQNHSNPNVRRAVSNALEEINWFRQRVAEPDEFDPSDMLVIYEAARHALADGNISDEIGQHLDLSDEHLHSILLKLERHLNL